MFFVSNPEISNDIKLLTEKFLSLEKEEFISYEEIQKILGYDVREKRYVVESAKKKALKEFVLISCISNKGYKRLSDTNIISDSERDLKRVDKSLKKSKRKLVSCDFGSLTNEDKIRHNTQATMIAVAHAAINKKSKNVIEKKCVEENNVLSDTNALAMIADLYKGKRIL